VPEVIFSHIDDMPWRESRSQLHGGVRVSVRNKILRRGPSGTFIYTVYDPGMVIEEHGHASNHVVYILGGSAMFGEVECRRGMVIFLEEGATFGPIVAGPEGTELVEFYGGDPAARPVDPTAFAALLAEQGIRPLPTDL
jgi:quercetin dioxygenase-like cupin family protein